MMRNLEAKFRLGDPKRAAERAEAIGFRFSGLMVQRDTFFQVASGKLKLRDEDVGSWLIHYEREHRHELELSNYQMVTVADPFAMRTMLSAALGVIAEIRKKRRLFLRRNIRFHLDEVDSLGVFGEIEAVLDKDEGPDDYRSEVSSILTALEVPPDALIDVSYFELMRRH
jgi:adenylate cyclase, class 2